MLIKVKIFPGVKKEKISKISDDSFEVRVKEKPKQGKANERLIEILSDYFDVGQNKIKIIRGSKRKNKTISIFYESDN